MTLKIYYVFLKKIFFCPYNDFVKKNFESLLANHLSTTLMIVSLRIKKLRLNV